MLFSLRRGILRRGRKAETVFTTRYSMGLKAMKNTAKNVHTDSAAPFISTAAAHDIARSNAKTAAPNTAALFSPPYNDVFLPFNSL